MQLHGQHVLLPTDCLPDIHALSYLQISFGLSSYCSARTGWNGDEDTRCNQELRRRWTSAKAALALVPYLGCKRSAIYIDAISACGRLSYQQVLLKPHHAPQCTNAPQCCSTHTRLTWTAWLQPERIQARATFRVTTLPIKVVRSLTGSWVLRGRAAGLMDLGPRSAPRDADAVAA